jgi:type IV secretion system protein TrbL
MKKNKAQLTTILFGIFLLFSSNCFAAGNLDTILQNFQSATSGWMNISQGYAQSIFVKLGGLALSFWAITHALEISNDPATFIAKFFIKMIWMTFFYTLVVMGPQWVPQITDTFVVMGKGFAGTTGSVATSPSQMIELGASVARTILGVWKTAAEGNISSIGNDLVLGLALVVAATFALIGFALVAFQLLIAQIEIAIVAGVGFVMTGFLAAPATKTFGENYFGAVVSSGVKLMFIFALASLGQPVADSLIKTVLNLSTSGAVPVESVLAISLTGVIYGALCLQVPSMAAGVMSGAVSASFGSIAGGAMAAGGAAVGAAMAAGGAAVGAAKAGMDIGGRAKNAMDYLSQGAATGGDSLGDSFTFPSSSNSIDGPSNPLGNDPFAGFSAPTKDAPSTFSGGMDKLNQGISGLAASEGASGGGTKPDTGTHGS